MTEVFKLLGTIAIDASGVETTLNDTSEKTAVFSEKVQKHFRNIAATAALVFSLDKVKDFANGCVEAYATISAEESAFEQIMGDYSDNAQAKMQQIADQTGVVTSRLTPYMTSLTSKFKGLGYGIDEATDLASDGLLMASDAAAFWDRSLDDSMSHLNSFINGSYEGGEAIGLFANDTQMAQRALEQGLIGDTKEWSQLDEATKQFARLNEAKRQFAESGITGQAEREAGSYANQMQNLESLWTRFQAIIGQPILEEVLLPIVQKLSEFLQWCQDNPEVLEKVFGKLGEIAGNVSSTFFDGAIDVFKWIVENEGALTGTLTAIALAFAGIGLATHPILTALSAIAGFIMWMAGTYDERHDEFIAGIDENKPIAERNAGKYAGWTDAQKDAAYDYLYAYDGGFDTAPEVEAMKAAGLSQAAIDEFRNDVSTALAEGDYSITIEDTWFDETAETELQGQLDEMGLEATVSLTPDYSRMQYSDLQTFYDSDGAYLPGYGADGSHASGLDRVPFDGYRAILHKGEAVLNATNAAVWRNGGGMGDTSRLEAKLDGLMSIMNQVASNTANGHQVVLETGAVVGQLLPAMDAGLGTVAIRKGRRNG
jgi:hypothetical protein